MLGDERYVSLATFRRSGAAVATPVWVAPLDGKLYAFTARESGKVKRLRHSPRARVSACDARGRVRGPWHDAVARLVDDPRTVERAYVALRRKYGWQMRVTDLVSRLAGRLDKRAILEIELRGGS
jgi:hypothetical protein